MALNNLDRFITATRNPLSLASLFERDPEALPILLQIFSTSQYLSDLLITDSESYDLVRMTEGQPVSRETLVNELASEVAALAEEPAVLAALRRFKRRETLRISYGDIIRGQHLDTVARQISHVADAILEAAVGAARRNLEQKRGIPRTPQGEPARFVVLAMGKLGGDRAELFKRHRPDLSLRRRRRHRRPAADLAIASFSTASPATWFGCSPSRPSWASSIASICGCGRRGSAGRS